MLGKAVTYVLLSAVLIFSVPFVLFAQGPNATITGFVTDETKAVIGGVKIEIINLDTNTHYVTTSNGDGIYTVSSLPPGNYKIEVEKEGFKSVVKSDVVLHVQDTAAINFAMAIGSISEVVTVEAGGLVMNTTDASVGTVVDRQFAENLPMNGRSFQSLIELTPGVVITPSSQADAGQFSVNGERAAANYWMVDGVSANIGVGANFNAGNGFGGALGAFSVLGGTNSLVSVDAMQEFRIQTSTYAPEFGRTPGGQISILTRSGTNQFHGTAFDYLRNSVLDANNWFADSAHLPKPEERQNDFGGTLSGAILKDGTFFFFSYEGLRLRLPETALTTVPDLATRQNAAPAIQPYLDAFPRPNGPDNPAEGVAQFNASYSNRATLDAYSIRIDHKLADNLNLFGRYNNSPSQLVQRYSAGYPLSVVQPITINTQTATVGLTWAIGPQAADDLRLNYSATSSASYFYLDNFGGAAPLASVPFPSPFNSATGYFVFYLYPSTGVTNGALSVGNGSARNRQRQFNLVDSFSIQEGTHSLKFGVDYRWLGPSHDPAQYVQEALFTDLPSALAGNPLLSVVESGKAATLEFQNLGLFAQDTWRILPRLTLTYGLRWDVDFAPRSMSGPNIPRVVGYNLNDLSNLALGPSGASPFQTAYNNFAPRVGLAYQLVENKKWQTVVRGGFGVFYDLVSSEAGGLLGFSYPYGATAISFGSSFPLDPATASPPPITPSQLASAGAVLSAFDPNLKLPYSLQWNVSLEQSLGAQQSLSASYIGSVGRRLLQTAYVSSPNPDIYSAVLVGNSATSDYNALQVQFQRRLTHGLQALGSYTWSHSIDDASAGSYSNAANTVVPTVNPNLNRGDSDFDIRNAFSAGLTYDIPAPRINALSNAVLGGWSLESLILARSAPPITVYDGSLSALLNGYTDIRPDVTPGIPLYVYGPQYPGGKAINGTPNQAGTGCVGPFCPPPADSAGNPLRQGTLGRNALRGFGATQWDFAIHRDFLFRESLKLQFRAEMFNVLNHPNFGQPVADISNPQFGLSTQILAQSLNSQNLGGGGFSPLYQIGGPRSIQLALKLMF